MSSFSIKPFKASDFELLEPRSFEHDIMGGLGDICFAPLFEKHPSWTGWVDGKAAFSAGLYVKWRGSGEVWALTSKLVEKHPIWFHSSVVRFLKETVEKHNLWRVEAVIQAEHLVSCRWAAHLGFIEEGTSPAFGPSGETFIRYAKIYMEHLPEELTKCHL